LPLHSYSIYRNSVVNNIATDKLLVAVILGIYINYTSYSQLDGTFYIVDVTMYCTGMWDLAFSYCTRNLHWFISKANTNWNNVTV